jgi:hypothetical protein
MSTTDRLWPRQAAPWRRLPDPSRGMERGFVYDVADGRLREVSP